MATRVSRAMTAPLPSPNHSRAAKAADTFKAVKELLVNAEIQDFLALEDESTALREANKLLKGDVESQDRRIADLLSKNDEKERQAALAAARLDRLEKEKAALSSKLTAAQSELKETRQEMAQRDEQRVADLEKLKRKLQVESDKLQKLQSFSIELLPVARSQEEIKSRLVEMYSSARALAEDYFGMNLPPQILLDDTLWKKVKEYLKLGNAVPLPLSNSLVAKQMRTAAFLAVLMHEMRGHIYQPTYLQRDNADLNKIMEGLIEEGESERESHLRAVFLRLSTLCSKDVDAIAASHIDTVVHNVTACVLDLIPEKLKADFKSKLKAYCTQACEHWKFIQQLEGKINLDFDANEATPLNPTTDPTPKAAARANGTASTPKKPSTTAAAATPTDPAESLEDAVVIWPAFYNESSDRMETLVRGHLLTAPQIAAAKAEEKAQQPTGPRRAQRQNSRASRSYSMVGGSSSSEVNGSALGEGQAGPGLNGSATATASGSGSGSGSFLSQGSGGGRKGGS